MATKTTYSRAQDWAKAIRKIALNLLQEYNLNTPQWHLGKVQSIVSSYMLNVTVNGSSTVQKIPCNPDINFNVNDEVFVMYMNGDTRAKFVPFKRATGSESRAAYSEQEYLLTTSSSNIISITPPINGNYCIYIYPRMLLSANLTIEITYTDQGGVQSYYVLNNVAETLGPIRLNPEFINATTSSNIVVSGLTSVANACKVSVSIVPM